MLFLGGEVWIPVEITKIGRDSVLEAWAYGKREFDAYELQPNLRGFYKTREAQQLFRPVGLRSSEQEIGLDDPDEIVDFFVDDINNLAGLILGRYQQRAEERGRDRDYNRYGIAAARLHQFITAQRAFEKAIELSGSGLLAAHANLGVMYYLMDGGIRSGTRVV